MMSSSNVGDGPYRATKLWNEVVRLFRSGMPVKRHWHQFRAVHDSFSGAEAVDWLHHCLKNNVNFGPQVTREQTIRLLCKFLKNHVIEDISSRWGSEDFSDGKQLYRFPLNMSPSKLIRQPLALLSSNALSPRQKGIAEAKNRFLRESRLRKSMEADKAAGSPSSIWQQAYLSSLKDILQLKSIEDVLPCGILQTEWLYHNCTKDDLSTFTEHGMPYWVISAMQCLANWPNSEGSGLPNYPGFERDIFSAICGYFQALSEPLLTFNLYELFITVFGRAESLDKVVGKSRRGSCAVLLTSPDSDSGGDAEVEKLRKKLMQAQIRHTNKAIRHRKSFRHGVIPTKYSTFAEDADCSDSLKRWRWELDDVASRNTWNERFSSIQKLDELEEESSSQAGTTFENYASLPELRANTLPRSATKKPMLLADAGSERVCQSSDSYPAPEDLGEGQSSSVENLLLDMSYRMQSEMEDALMRDNGAKSPRSNQNLLEVHEETYERLRLDVNRSPSSSPTYRTMKPIFEKKPTTARNDRFQKSAAVRKCDTLRGRKYLNSIEPNLSKENVYMEISASQPNISLTAKMFHPTLGTYVEHRNPTIAERRSLKLTREDSENNLMFSPIHKPMSQQDQTFHGGRTRREPSHHRDNIPKSDIIERREVPPSCVKQTQNLDFDVIKRRLPYVSNSMVPDGAADPSVQSNLSRSHSTLSRRSQRRGSFSGSGNLVSCQPDPFAQRFAWNNRSLLPNAKSCNNFTELSKQRDEPSSPLTTAFDSAKTRLNSSAESSKVVESMQLCLLLLPPSSRSKLRLLLRLIVKMCGNPHLVDLHELLSTRAYVLQELSSCIIRRSIAAKNSQTRAEKQIINVFLEHTTLLMSKPTQLGDKVQEMLPGVKDGSTSDHQRPLRRKATFCKQVTVQEYEKERRPVLEESLKQLLHDIVHDNSMGSKEKRKKLKQFQKSYPEIYKTYYPAIEPILEGRNTSKKKPMLSTALKRLRSLRS